MVLLSDLEPKWPDSGTFRFVMQKTLFSFTTICGMRILSVPQRARPSRHHLSLATKAVYRMMHFKIILRIILVILAKNAHFVGCNSLGFGLWHVVGSRSFWIRLKEIRLLNVRPCNPRRSFTCKNEVINAQHARSLLINMLNVCFF